MTKTSLQNRNDMPNNNQTSKLEHQLSFLDHHQGLQEAYTLIFESLLNAELEAHIGFRKNDSSPKNTANRRNGHTLKTINGTFGKIIIKNPRDREATFKPIIISKRQTDVLWRDSKVLALYTQGMNQKDITPIINDLYASLLPQEKIDLIKDAVANSIKKWLIKKLKSSYSNILVSRIYVELPNQEGEMQNHIAFLILGLDFEGHTSMLGLPFMPKESLSNWITIFSHLKARGIKEVLSMSMSGVNYTDELKDVITALFPKTIVERTF